MNAPERSELLTLPDGASKVTVTPETNFPNGATFLFEREGHTLGNALRYQLLQDPHVVLAGYKVMHPLQYNFQLKVQTDNHNGNYTPEQAVKDALIKLQAQSMQFVEKLTVEATRARSDHSRTDMVNGASTMGGMEYD